MGSMLHKMSPSKHTMMDDKYITRYEPSKGKGYTYVGWRLCITRHGERFEKYFSDRSYGSAEHALEAAVHVRDVMLAEMQRGVSNYKTFFNSVRRRISLRANETDCSKRKEKKAEFS